MYAYVKKNEESIQKREKIDAIVLSNRSSQVGTFAYTQGDQVQIAPNHERHLNQEESHAIQRKINTHIPQVIQMVNIDEFETEEDKEKFKNISEIIVANKGVTTLQKLEKNQMVKILNWGEIYISTLQWDIEEITDKIDLINEFIESVKLLGLDGFKKMVSIHQNLSKISKYMMTSFPLYECIPKPFIKTEVPKEIHSIWIQGEDYKSNGDFEKVFELRKAVQSKNWENVMWLYNVHDELKFELSGKLYQRKVILNSELAIYEVSFKKTMAEWKGDTRPTWVDSFMVILEILERKKAYVAMSDIIRMIILYYRGGLYADLKIEFGDFDNLFTKEDTLGLAPGKENWALLADRGCIMISDIMNRSLKRIEDNIDVEKLPIREEAKGYPREHAEFHEAYGPFEAIRYFSNLYKTYDINEMNEKIKLTNPKIVNSWVGSKYYNESIWNTEIKKQTPAPPLPSPSSPPTSTPSSPSSAPPPLTPPSL